MRAAALLLAAALSAFAGARAETGRVPVSFLFSYDPDRPENPATRRIQSLAAAEGTIEPVKWGSLVLPGGGGRASFMLALAGGAAPDIYKAWFHILRHDISQGFVYPLDEWVDAGSFKPADLWDEVRFFGGHVWALPTPGTA